jgi:hypothetical protein
MLGAQGPLRNSHRQERKQACSSTPLPPWTVSSSAGASAVDDVPRDERRKGIDGQRYLSCRAVGRAIYCLGYGHAVLFSSTVAHIPGPTSSPISWWRLTRAPERRIAAQTKRPRAFGGRAPAGSSPVAGADVINRPALIGLGGLSPPRECARVRRRRRRRGRPSLRAVRSWPPFPAWSWRNSRRWRPDRNSRPTTTWATKRPRVGRRLLGDA